MKDEHFPSDHDFLSDDDLNFSLEDDFDMAALDALLGESPAEAAEPPAPPEEPEKAGAVSPVKNASQEEKSGPRPSILRFMARDRKTTLLVSGIAIAAVIVCVILGILIAAALDPYDNRILPNTTIGGIPVGGMTKLEAYSAIKDATATTFRETAMEVSLPDGTLSLSPDDTKAKLNVWSAASAAFNLGRKGGDAQQQAAVEASQNGGNTMDLLPHLKIDQDYIRSQLEAYAAEHNVAHSELHYRLTGRRSFLFIAEKTADYLDGMYAEALEYIKSYWGCMLRDGADTFWEAYAIGNPTLSPYNDPLMNSFCHAWSCSPSYFIRKYFI